MQSPEVRVLGEADRDALEFFLQQHLDETMFIRFNLYRGGLTYEGKPGQSIFWGAFDNSEITSVLSLSWNGYIQCFVTTDHQELAKVACDFMKSTGKSAAGINGVSSSTRRMMNAFGLSAYPTSINNDETLMSVTLSELISPPSSDANNFHIRPLHKKDAATLYEWQLAYEIEALGQENTPELQTRVRQRIPGLIERSGYFSRMLENEGTPVSRTGFSAILPDAVMVAGVFTPAELRNRGYAKIAVYKSLKEVEARGVKKAVLFTASSSAEKAYQGVGFRPIGKFALINFVKPWQPV